MPKRKIWKIAIILIFNCKSLFYANAIYIIYLNKFKLKSISNYNRLC